MTSAGPKLPSTGSSSGGSQAWTNPSRITTENASSAQLVYTDGTDSDSLYGSGFAWPAGIATVTNVLFEVKMKAVYAAGSVLFRARDSNLPIAFGFTGGTGNPLAWVTAYNGAPNDAGAAIKTNTDIYDLYSKSGENTLGFTADVDAYRITITYTVAGSLLPSRISRVAVRRAAYH